MKNRKVIYKIRVGSHLYGLNTPESDEDFLSVFIPSDEDILGLNKVDLINNSTKSSSEDRRNTVEDVDDVSYSLPKFLHLLMGNNPNIIETLFATKENIITLEPEFQPVLDNYDKFVSTKVFHSFTGYAYSQRRKLITKKERYSNLIYAIKEMEHCWTEDRLGDHVEPIDEWDADLLNRWVKYYKGSKHNPESFHKGMDLNMIHRNLKRERDTYGWRVKTETFETLGYDIKFAYHLIRILHEGVEILQNGRIDFPVSGASKDYIMDIRNAKVSYDDLLKIYDLYSDQATKAKEESVIREKPDFKWANNYLVDTLKESIKKIEVWL